MPKSNAAEVEVDETVEDAPVEASATLARKFADFPVTVPVMFTEGQTLTADQARWASSQFATVIGNTFGGIVRKMDEVPEDFSAQSLINQLVADFTFTPKRGTGTGTSASTDPVARMVHFLAGEELKRRIIAKGLKVRAIQTAKGADGETSKFAELLAALIERDGDSLRAQAEAVIAAQASIDNDADDLLEGIAA